MKSNQDFIAQIRELIANDYLEEAIEAVQNLLKESPKLDKVILQAARYNDLMNSIHDGTLNYENTSTEKNKIRAATLEILRNIENGINQNKEVYQEVEKFLTGQITQKADKIYNIGKINNGNFS